MTPSPRQLDVLQLIANHHRLMGEAPSAKWLAASLEVHPKTVLDYLKALERLGLIRRQLAVAPRPVLTPAGQRAVEAA